MIYTKISSLLGGKLSLVVGLAVFSFAAQLSVGEERSEEKKFDYSWESLKTQPIPQWFDDGKFGIFIHWGPYSVVGYSEGGVGYAEHIPKQMYRDSEHYYPLIEERFGAHPPEFGYKDIVPLFTASDWDPDEWAVLFSKAGARYVVMTAEHHDGYAMWDSELTPWAATKTGPMRDLVGDLGKAVRTKGLKYAPSYHRERHNGFFALERYAQASPPHPDVAEEMGRVPEAKSLYGPFQIDEDFVDQYVARWKEIERKYKPDLMWLDHVPVFHDRWCEEYNHPDIRNFHTALQRMIADYYNAAESWGKDVYVNNKGPDGAHNWPLGVGFREADNLELESISTKWQNPATLGTSYGYLEAEEVGDLYKSPTELIHLLCDVVSKNGNLLLNIGPRADGIIPDGMQMRLLAMGKWLDVNGDSIYGTRPWKIAKQKDPNIRFTTKDDALYAIVFDKPTGPFVVEMDRDNSKGFEVEEISLLGSNALIKWSLTDRGLRIVPPSDLPGEHAWSFRIKGVASR